MKPLSSLFYEAYEPRQKHYKLSMRLKESENEHTIRINQNGREIIKVTEESREQAFNVATKELVRRFPIKRR
jgi:hypothetical protein